MRSSLESAKKALERAKNKNTLVKLSLLYEKIDLEGFSSLLNRQIKYLEYSFENMKEQIKKTEEKSVNKIEQLNLLKKQLYQVNKEWVKWKTQLIRFKNYEGILKKAICKNTKNNRKELCEKEIVSKNK